jgi:molecular chaperone GrpE (heat shock protein)
VGLAITIKEFEEVLFGEGYKKIFPEPGEEFNETRHEAVDVVETENKNEDNTVASVTLTGWEFGEGSIIRPAKVVVKKFNN